MASSGNGKVSLNVNIREETKNRIIEITEKTFRGMGDVVDLAVARLYQSMQAGDFDSVDSTEPGGE